MKDGRRFGGPPKPYQPPSTPQGEVNLTDPDARVMKAFRGYVQGYNLQAAVNEQHIVLAAEITVESVDFAARPMVDATLRELEQAGIREKPRAAVADAGYWNEQHMDEVIGEHGIPVLIPPDSSRRKGERPGWTGGRYTFMRRVLETDLGEALYRSRKQTVEPVIGHTKHTESSIASTDEAQSGAHRVAPTDDDPQPHQAPQSPDSHSGGLNRPPRDHTAPHNRPSTTNTPTAGPSQPHPRTFPRHPHRKGAANAALPRLSKASSESRLVGHCRS